MKVLGKPLDSLRVMLLTCRLSSSAYLFGSLAFIRISVPVSPILRLCFHLQRLCALELTPLLYFCNPPLFPYYRLGRCFLTISYEFRSLNAYPIEMKGLKDMIMDAGDPNVAKRVDVQRNLILAQIRTH